MNLRIEEMDQKDERKDSKCQKSNELRGGALRRSLEEEPRGGAT